ncbi:Testis-expressed sequence 10 protein-like protein [Harpegnathos saltator]|uniref:Testis-expressed sequence 10 protein-like protein n=1 Tax=Harpegnathos saltator TaxID=610380 RepID=E2BZ61_HARSA|nr:Testis-expressed sequence 10 protein-like protein [Harpegnathos saltator]
MAKGHKHAKRLKSEKAKVKLKSKTNQLPKNLNVTNTSFKAKKIVIREQLKHHDQTEILSTRKLNIKDLLMRFHHHNSTVRGEALKELKEILVQYSIKALHSELGSLLRGIAALSLDKEKNIRRDSLNALNLILESISKKDLLPYFDVLISYLNCAMTHINPYIKEDSLHFLDILLHNCGNMLVKDSHKILPNFVSMICTLHDNKYSGQLTTIPNFKNTNIKWRTKVLERLANMFNHIISEGKIYKATYPKIQVVHNCTRFFPVYSSKLAKSYEIDFNKHADAMSTIGKVLSTEEFIKYIDKLMPLIFDIWLEVCPDGKLENYTYITISNETFLLLKSAIKIIQSIIEYIEYMNTLDHDDYDAKHTKYWFIHKFHQLYMKNFLSKFPYNKVRESTNKPRKCQEDYSGMEFNDNILEENLGICQIHVWFTSITSQKKFSKSIEDHCLSVIKYLNGMICQLMSKYNCLYIIIVISLYIFYVYFFQIQLKTGASMTELCYRN